MTVETIIKNEEQVVENNVSNSNFASTQNSLNIHSSNNIIKKDDSKILKKCKNARRKRRAKQRKRQLEATQKIIDYNLLTSQNNDNTKDSKSQIKFQNEKSENDSSNIKIEYISEERSEENNPEMKHFLDVFSHFSTAEELFKEKPSQSEIDRMYPTTTGRNKEGSESQGQNAEDPNNQDGSFPLTEKRKRLSNKQRKLRDRLTIAQLKRVVDRPDIVELHDPNSPDPTLLIHLKSIRNTVPVPAHQIIKKKYLQGKRGIEKPPFQLPKAIQDTGIGTIRDSQHASDSHKSSSQKQRQRVNPSLGKIDIDYEKLYAAFFKYMEKPKMTEHGDIYYAGKEFEVKFSRFVPGKISKRLRNALHMQENSPPPWLINMQRFGPPPSYPELKIPGLNAPLPPNCKYGYGDGHQGKPPVDENGYPKYGDPFGVNLDQNQQDDILYDYSTERQGVIEDRGYDEDEGGQGLSDSDREIASDMDGENSDLDLEDDSDLSGALSVTSSVVSGLETPPVLSIRKEVGSGIDTPEQIQTQPSTETSSTQQQLYQVLEQKESHVSDKEQFGSSHTYDLSKTKNSSNKEPIANNSTSTSTSVQQDSQPQHNRYQVSLDVEELQSLDDMTIKRRYQEAVDAEREKRSRHEKSQSRRSKRDYSRESDRDSERDRRRSERTSSSSRQSSKKRSSTSKGDDSEKSSSKKRSRRHDSSKSSRRERSSSDLDSYKF